MSLKKRLRPSTEGAYQIAKTSKALVKAGMAGVVILEESGNTRIQLIGNQKRAIMAIQTALEKHPLLKDMAMYAAGPKVTVSRGEAPEGSLLLQDQPLPEDTGIPTEIQTEDPGADPGFPEPPEGYNQLS